MSNVKRLRLLLIFIPMLACSFCAYQGWSYINSAPWGMFGGDCVEAAGSVTVTGTVLNMNNQPVEGVQIRAVKAEGWCPQSIAFDSVKISDENGNFLTGGWIFIGDPEVQIEISADGYSVCSFNYDASLYKATTLELNIILDETMQVEGRMLVDEVLYVNSDGTPVHWTEEVETCS
jgi:hypothetical protein